MALRFWVGGTGTWDQASTTHWSTATGGATGASVPVAADDVIFDANSGAGTVTISANAPCNSLASSASALHTISISASVTLTVGSAAAGNGNIALDLSGFTSMTWGASAAISLVSTSATQQTVNGPTGTTAPATTFNGAGGSWLLGSAYNCGGNVSLLAGTLNTNGFACAWFSFTSTGSTTRVLTLGTSTITINGTSTTPWSVASAGLTISAASSTIAFTNLGTVASATVTLNTFTYGTVTMAGVATNAFTFASGGTVIAKLQMAGPLSVKSAITTKTVTNFRATGTSGNLVTLQSSTPGTAWTISKAAGTVQCDWVSLQDSTATGGAAFYAGANSTNVSGNTGWTFTAVPGAAQTATASFAGGFGPTATHRALTGAVSFAGAVSRSITKPFAAGLSSGATMVRSVSRPLAATASFAGQAGKFTARSLPASLPLSGSFVKQSRRALSGTVAFAGVVARLHGKFFTAGLSLVGGMGGRQITRTLTAALPMAGNVRRATTRALTAALPSAGNFSTFYRARVVPLLAGRVAAMFRSGKNTPASRAGTSSPSQNDGEV